MKHNKAGFKHQSIKVNKQSKHPILGLESTNLWN